VPAGLAVAIFVPRDAPLVCQFRNAETVLCSQRQAEHLCYDEVCASDALAEMALNLAIDVGFVAGVRFQPG
jgi:hypothetical protein